MSRESWLKRLAKQFQSRRQSSPRVKRRKLFAALRLEPLENRALLAADFGDAPTPYPVLAVENGAQHTTGGALKLGASVDSELDGTHSANVDADGADDNGVTFGTVRVGALGATVTVNVTGGTGKLDAWIDFNGDGSWGGPGEQIFASQNVAAGNNSLTFDVPSWAQDGVTFARFRLSSAGALGTEGAAADGEVEDYPVTVIPPAAGSGLFSSGHAVAVSGNGLYSLVAADVDGDGDMDVLSATAIDFKVTWYENDGNQNYTTHVISTTANGVQSVFAADVDGDGDTDVLSASDVNRKIAWYENDGSQNFTERIITTSALGVNSVFVADVDGDGDIDVLSAGIDGKIAWYRNDGNQVFTAQTVTLTATGAHSVFAADVDGDGDMDVLSASYTNDRIAWYENDGNQVFAAHTVSTTVDGAWSVFATDVDGDGDLDILSASRIDDTIAWYENDGNQNFTTRIISTAADGAMSVFAADLDGDGDTDALSASWNDGKTAWYENDGNQNFTAHTIISTSLDRSVFAADMDADGDLDVLSMQSNNRIFWYENLPFPVDFGDAPAPYPTTLAENGARHNATGPILGAGRDSEVDGSHSAGADSDGADEDGVTFGSIRVGDLGATVTVNVTGAAGKLDAWIDFNGDGSWGGPGEHIFVSQNVVVGNNDLTFDVPSSAKDGVTFARFRVSTAGGLGIRGAAADGEVEDYAVTISPPAAATGVFGDKNVISTAAPGWVVTDPSDVDGDGDMDLLSLSVWNGRIDWYENDGNRNFTAHLITTDALGTLSILAADLDGDGDTDFLSSVYRSDGQIAWYENDGDQNFTAHTEAVDLQQTITVATADVDGDGDTDVLTASPAYAGKITWYENDGGQNFTAHTVATDAYYAHSVQAADMDGDGDMDVVTHSFYEIVWYENDGNQTFSARTISTGTTIMSVSVADVDQDGDMDFLAALAVIDTIAWYENDGNETFTSHSVYVGADYPLSVIAADVDGDGDTDVIGAALYDQEIAWYENDGNQVFTPRTIGSTAHYSRAVSVADFDGDGDLDALSTSYYDRESEIAWYENTNPVSVDFGDAPAPYPTTLAENGARHNATGPILGAGRDSEVDGVHSANADADGADEDGVTFGTIRVGDLDATVTVNVTGTAGKLDAWIDFNGDGSWGGPGEQIFASQNVALGNNNLTFDVPSWAKEGETYARFRLSSAGGLGTEGPAADGEVEDYAVTVVPPVAGSGAFSSEIIVSTAVDGAHSVFAADLDGDGDMDMLSVSAVGDSIQWHENDGNANFTQHTITTAVDRPLSVFAADVDGDGDLDVISTSYYLNKIAWYENDGNQNFTPRELVSSSLRPTSIIAADVDGDGDTDLLSSSRSDARINWYENDGNQNFTERTIGANAQRAKAVYAADVDGDGDLDVLSASNVDDKIAWYENDGNQNFTEHAITTTADGAESVFATDMDGDGDMDVLSASFYDDTIAWYENDGNQVFTPHIIGTPNGANHVFATDVDGDGDMDVLSSSFFNDRIIWFRNNGNQNFASRVLTTAANVPYSVFAADVDGDGDMDVLSASLQDDKIAWYRQNNTPTISQNTLTIAEGSTVVLSSGNLNASDTDSPVSALTLTVSSVTGGQFELVAAPGVAITSFTQTQINSGAVQFVHNGGEAAPSYSLTASDEALSSASSVGSVTFTNVNDAPAIAANAITIAEGATLVLGSGNINTTDPDNTPAQLTYTASGVTGGQFELVAAPGVAISSFTQAQIAAGMVQFVHNGGEAAAAYSLTVSDGALSSGVSPGSVTFTNINDAPVISANSISVVEGATLVLGAGNINTTDPDNAPAQLNYTASGVTGGQFELVAAPGAAITSFTQAQINSGAAQFVHDGGEAAAAYSLVVSDGALSSVASAAAVSFTNVNDAPVISANAISIAEGATLTLGSGNINTTDPDNTPTQLSYTASNVIAGRFALASLSGTAIVSFTQAQVNAGHIVFVHDGGEVAPSYSLTVSDGLLTSAASTPSVSFTGTNDAPVISVNAVNIAEGSTLTLGSGNINTTDPDNTPAQLIYTATGVMGGQFELLAAPGVAVTNFTQAQINAGAVQFVHNGGEAAPSYSLTVSDGSLASAASASAVSFANVNDAPVISANSLSVSEGGTLVIGSGNINSTDPDNTPAQLTYTATGVTGGRFELVAAPGVAIASFTQAQVNAGAVQFVHNGDETAPSYSLTVSDGSLSSAASSSAVTFSNVNDAPVIATNTITIAEGATATLGSSNLNATDPDNSPAQLTYTATNVSGGQFALAGGPGTAITTFTQAQINAGQVVFVHNGGEAAPNYSITVSDGSLSSASSSPTASFTGVNDAPVITSNSLNIT